MNNTTNVDRQAQQAHTSESVLERLNSDCIFFKLHFSGLSQAVSRDLRPCTDSKSATNNTLQTPQSNALVTSEDVQSFKYTALL